MLYKYNKLMGMADITGAEENVQFRDERDLYLGFAVKKGSVTTFYRNDGVYLGLCRMTDYGLSIKNARNQTHMIDSEEEIQGRRVVLTSSDLED